MLIFTKHKIITNKEAIDLMDLGFVNQVLKYLYSLEDIEIIKSQATVIFWCKSKMFIQNGKTQIVNSKVVSSRFAQKLAEKLEIEFAEV